MTGIFAIDKPEGFTSFDVVAKLRGILGTRKIGHGGTLDPMATGVLPIFVGRATKVADLLPDQTKRYTATALFGKRTDTGDITGDLLETSDVCPGEQALSSALEKFVGPGEQLPPMYSAVKVDGRRLYEIARRGETVVRKPRTIEIHALELLGYDRMSGRFTVDVRCSKGTYIRTLVEDIAASLGALATLSALRRTASGPFRESDCTTFEQLQQAKETGMLEEMLRGVDSAFERCSDIRLDDRAVRAFLNGVRQKMPAEIGDGELVRVYSGGRFLGLAKNEGGRMEKVFQLEI